MRLPSLFSILSSRTTGSTTGAAVATILLALSLSSGVMAQDRSTESGEAQIQDPNVECTAYYYAPSATKISSFPPIWQPADILPSDTVALAKYNSILPSIPTNISVKGDLTGNFSNFTPTYPASDPDCWWTYHQCNTPKLAGLPPDVYNVPEPLTMGYGFDDGPNCSHNAFYDYLSEQNQKATMFYIGSNVMDWPLEAQRGLADGHEICVHTWSHRYMTAFNNTGAFAELYYTMQAITLVTGVTPTCWRPPYGDVDDRIRSIANGLGLRTIIWKYDSNDWKAGTGNITAATVDSDYQDLVTAAQNGTFNTAGAIMLTHELNNFTMQEAIKWYEQLKTSFKYLVPVGVALNKTQPYVQSNYTLPSFSQYASAHPPNTSSSSGGSSTGNKGQKSDGTSLRGAAIGSVMAALMMFLAFATMI